MTGKGVDTQPTVLQDGKQGWWVRNRSRGSLVRRPPGTSRELTGTKHIPGSSLPWQKQLCPIQYYKNLLSKENQECSFQSWKVLVVGSGGGTETGTFQAQHRDRSQSSAVGQQWFHRFFYRQRILELPGLMARPLVQIPIVQGLESSASNRTSLTVWATCPTPTHCKHSLLLLPVSCCWGKKHLEHSQMR